MLNFLIPFAIGLLVGLVIGHNEALEQLRNTIKKVNNK